MKSKHDEWMKALEQDQTELVRQMIAEKSIDINEPNADGVYAIHLATDKGNVDLVADLISAGANVNVAINGVTPLSIAAWHGNDEMVRLLLSKNAETEVHDNNMHGNTPLISASWRGHAGVVSQLLRAGANKEAQDNMGKTALIVASGRNHEPVANELLSAGAKTEGETQDGSTALIVAASEGNIGLVQLLLSHNANIEAKDAKGRSALILASGRGCRGMLSRRIENANYSKIVELLLSRHANESICDQEGFTALMYAVSFNHKDAVNFLLAAGANKRVKAPSGDDAHSLAKLAGNTDIIALIERFETFSERLAQIKYRGEVDEAYKCPISLSLMDDPITASSGITFDRVSLIDYFKHRGDPECVPCPITKRSIYKNELYFGTSILVKRSIESFVSSQEQIYRANEVERQAHLLSSNSMFPNEASLSEGVMKENTKQPSRPENKK